MEEDGSTAKQTCLGPQIELLLCFESFFLAPSLSTGPQENHSAAIAAFTVSYMNDIPN